MIVIGLTGSIGMGKSTVAALFRRLGIRVCSADAIVHRLLERGGAAVQAVGMRFPGVVRAGAVDRKILGGIVFTDPAGRRALEAILHPMVVAEEEGFVRREARKGAKIVVVEIPLLFETGAEARCDLTVVVTAPARVQRQRVMRRSGMTEEKFAAILRAQMPDGEKRRRAGAVIQTGLGLRHTVVQVAKLVMQLRKLGG